MITYPMSALRTSLGKCVQYSVQQVVELCWCVVCSDPGLQRASYRGSNSSINSTSSANSTKSSVDNAPLHFTVGSPEEDFFVNGSVYKHRS